jgi:hypothetical protein
MPDASQLLKFLREYCVSGVSVGVATVCTNPIGPPYAIRSCYQLAYLHTCTCTYRRETLLQKRPPGASPIQLVLRRHTDVVKVRLQLRELQAGRRLPGGLAPDGMVSYHMRCSLDTPHICQDDSAQ